MLWAFMLGGAALGGWLGYESRKQQYEEEVELLEYQKKQAWQQYLYGKEASDEQYAINKLEAQYQLGEQKRALDQNVGLFTEQYNTSLLAQAYAEQDARIQTEDAVGMSLAAEGASGTRGNEANETVRAYARQGLERSVDINRQQNAQTLKGTMNDAYNTATAINHERASWEQGGYRHQIKQSQDQYNLNIANLGQKDFEQRIAWAEPTRLDWITSIFGGASTGTNFGYGIGDMSRQTNAVSPKSWQDIDKKTK